MAAMEVKPFVPLVDYPREIRGSLRLVLQIKDAFIAAFNSVEEYRRQLLACQRGFSRGLAVYNLTVGLESIKQLRAELEEVERKVEAKAVRNRVLRHHLKKTYTTNPPSNVLQAARASRVLLGTSIPSHKVKRKKGVVVQCDGPPSLVPISAGIETALHGGLEPHAGEINVDRIRVPPEVDLSLACTPSGQPLLPVVEFYRGFFFLQMHFQVSIRSLLTADWLLSDPEE
ncbi:hypothetical protein SprV_0902679000 [Sparganum proliferum]